MTYVGDPGDAPASYSDHVARPWPATAALWQTQSATLGGQLSAETVLYNNAVVALNNALAPAAVVHLTLNGQAAADGANHTSALLFTFPRAGSWAVIVSAANSSGNTTHIDAWINGVLSFGADSLAGSISAPVFQTPAIPTGSILRVDVHGPGTGGAVISIFADMFFIPTQTNPH